MPKISSFSSFRKLNLVQRLINHVPARIAKDPVKGKRFLQWPLPGVKLDPPAVQMFLTMQGMTGKSDMLSYFSSKLEEMKPGPAARRDWYHRAISICTKAGQIETALAFCSAMVEDGIDLPIQTYMVLFRGVSSRNVKYLRLLQDFLNSGVVELDDFAFKIVMDSMAATKDPPQRIARAFRLYSAVRSADCRWVPPPSMYSVIIQAYASTGQISRAQYWLDRYRTRLLPEVMFPAEFLKFPKGQTVKENASYDLDATVEKNTSHDLDMTRDENVSNDSTTEQSTVADYSAKDEDAMTIEEKIQMKLGLSAPTTFTNPLCSPYTAMLTAYARSTKPPQDGLQWLFESMRADGISPDIQLCNTLISLFFRWRWKARACAIFDQLMTPPSLPTTPNARTFRLMFRGIAPPALLSRSRIPPSPLESRSLFQVMIAFTRLRLVRRAIREENNPISCSTFNAALNTFMRENDYAAAWVVLALFPHYDLQPSRTTMRTILVNLLARMRLESSLVKWRGGIFWIDRFLGTPRDAVFNFMVKNDKLLADNLFKIGRSAYSQLQGSGFKTFLKPSPHVVGPPMEDMRFLVALLRRALQAELGLQEDASDTEKTIVAVVRNAYRDLLPRGRDRRRHAHVETPSCIVIEEDSDNSDDDPS